MKLFKKAELSTVTCDPQDAEAQPYSELPQWQHFWSLEPCADSPFVPLHGADEKPLGLHWGAGRGQADGQRTSPQGR